MTTSAKIRRTEIIGTLKHEHFLKVADLSQRFGVSQTSIHRDLRQLEEQSLLCRVHGGLIASPLVRLGLDVSPEVTSQLRYRRSENEAIARIAATLVQPGDHLIFDSGILSYLTACALPGDLLTQGELTVITNSLLVALELAPWPGVETILLGGEYQAVGKMNLTGQEVLSSLRGLHADKMFITVEAIDILHGVTVASSGIESELAEGMVAACTRVILLVNSSKTGQASEHQIMPISSVECMVTSQDAPAEFVSQLRALGVQILIAQPGSRKAS